MAALKVLPSMSNDDIEDLLLENLPHGSGVNCKWEFDWLVNGKLVAKNAFHCMNDAGYYEGFADFSVKFHKPKSDLSEFVLVFNGDEASYLNKKHMLRDYLEETIHYAVTRKEGV